MIMHFFVFYLVEWQIHKNMRHNNSEYKRGEKTQQAAHVTASNAVCWENVPEGETALITGSNSFQKKLGCTEFGLEF